MCQTINLEYNFIQSTIWIIYATQNRILLFDLYGMDMSYEYKNIVGIELKSQQHPGLTICSYYSIFK